MKRTLFLICLLPCMVLAASEFETREMGISARGDLCEQTRERAERYVRDKLRVNAGEACRRLGGGWSVDSVSGGYQGIDACNDKLLPYRGTIDDAKVVCKRAKAPVKPEKPALSEQQRIDASQKELGEKLKREQQKADAQREEDEYWQRARAAKDSAVLQGYLERYPNGRYAGEARERQAALQKEAADFNQRNVLAGRWERDDGLVIEINNIDKWPATGGIAMIAIPTSSWKPFISIPKFKRIKPEGNGTFSCVDTWKDDTRQVTLDSDDCRIEVINENAISVYSAYGGKVSTRAYRRR